MSTVARLLARSSGPARVRARLKEQTRALNRTAVRLSMEHAWSARLVATPLPESVLGGDLLGLLSGPLQSLLRGEEPGPTAGEPAPGTRARLDAPTSQRRQRPAIQASDPTNREVRRGALGGSNGQSRSWRDVAGEQGPATDGHQVSRSPGIAAYATSATPASAGGAQVDAARDGRAKWRDGASGVTRPAVAALLARQVEKYFRPAPASPPSGAAADHPALSTSERAARAVPDQGNGAAAAPADVLMGRGWPALNGQQLAERLQTFVSGSVPPEPDHVTGAHDEGRRVEINNTFNIKVGSTEDSGDANSQTSLVDLSDQVAEILRRQAIQHGIDVT